MSASRDRDLYRALADPHRRRLLQALLEQEPLRLVDLAALLPLTRFATMKHLRLLEAAGIVRSVRRGREKWHYAEPSRPASLADWNPPKRTER